jgi:hypothetical protein
MGGTTYATYGDVTPPTWRRVVVCLAGPCAGVALGAFVLAVRALSTAPLSIGIGKLLVADLLWVNLGYGLVNFLPILPLDGGLVMQALLERVRGRPSPHLAAAISLVGAAALAAAALAWRLHWALFLLGWLALSHARALVDERRRRAAYPKACALSAEARAHLDANEPGRAAAALDAFPPGWSPDARLAAEVWVKSGQPERAIPSLRAVLEKEHDPDLVRTLFAILLGTRDLSAAAELALAGTAALSRDDFHAIDHQLFHAGRYADAVRVATAAFERFGHCDDAYNAACSYARLVQLDQAMRWLERAVAAGYRDGAHLAADEDLAALRGRADFQALRASLPQPVSG